MEANIYKIKSKQFKDFNGTTIKALNPKQAKEDFKLGLDMAKDIVKDIN